MMSCSATYVPIIAPRVPMMIDIILTRSLFQFNRVSAIFISTKGGIISDSAAPLEAPDNAINNPTLGTVIAIKAVNITNPKRNKLLA